MLKNLQYEKGSKLSWHTKSQSVDPGLDKTN